MFEKSVDMGGSYRISLILNVEIDLNVEIQSLISIGSISEKGVSMFNVNFMLAKAIQKDHLRTAKNGRLSRQMQTIQKKMSGKQTDLKKEQL